MARKDGYIMEHRLLVAKAMGRLLKRTEVVHHWRFRRSRKTIRIRLAEAERSLANISGDDACWLTAADLPSSTPALSESEFLESCRRFHSQLSSQNGVLQVGQMTIAQLEKEAFRLRAQLDKALAALKDIQNLPYTCQCTSKLIAAAALEKNK